MMSETDLPLKFRDGRHIRAARISAGLTRRELAERANLHENSIKYWETDKSPCWPGGHTIEQISSVLASFGVYTEVEHEGDYMIAVVRTG
jgi:transcriptional regulator with XRE-family HTH domain